MIRFFGKTDIGAKRQSNQDTFVCTVLCDNASLGVVCDGMGGCNGGSIASQTAVSVFTNYLRLNFVPHIDDDNRLDPSDFSVTELLRSAGAAANEAVFSKSHEEEELSGMGTTLVAALQIDDCVYVANIGDSRLYLITDDEMVQITHDLCAVSCGHRRDHARGGRGQPEPQRDHTRRRFGGTHGAGYLFH